MLPPKGNSRPPPIVTGKGAAELHAAFLEKVVHLSKVIAFNRPSGNTAIKGELVPVLEHRVEGDGNGIILKQVGHVVARDELPAREACGILRGIVELYKWVGRAMGGGRCARVSI